MDGLLEKLDEEIARASSLRGLLDGLTNYAIETQTRDLSLIDKSIAKLFGFMVRDSVLSMSWDYAVNCLVDYVEEIRDDIIKIGFSDRGNYKTVEEVTSSFFPWLGHELYPTDIISVLKESELEKYR